MDNNLKSNEIAAEIKNNIIKKEHVNQSISETNQSNGHSNGTSVPDRNDKVKKTGKCNCNSSYVEDKPEGRVLVIYTGGTIGMMRNEQGALAPIPNKFVKTLKTYPHMHDRNYAEKRFGLLDSLVLPMRKTDGRRIIYNVLEYSPLLDSSNMTMDDWIKIASDIREHYEFYDGFVVLHGTDTLSYTASALSFMLEALGKTVVITGSQLPIFDTRSDGLHNFLTSLVIAGNYNIPEVCVFFDTHLMRGNRTSKMAAASFDAFSSPNCPPLAIAGIQIEVNYQSIFRPCALEKFHVHKVLNRNVGLLRIFPSITADLVRTFVQPPIEGVILQTYGAGNIPANRQDILDVLRSAAERGVIIVNITQCTKDGVTDIYEPGKLLIDAGVTIGYDLTPEAALTKLAYVLSKTEWDIWTKRKMMKTNLRGELTTNHQVDLQDKELLMGWLGLHSETELLALAPTIFPALMMQAVLSRDLAKIVSLKNNGADVSQLNIDSRTVLHIACCEGDINMVKALLEMGANVHIKDRFDRTPLTEAVENDYHEIIKLLRQCGAHLHEDPVILGQKLCNAAASGNLKRLQSFQIAGANLSQADSSGRTALHNAALHNRPGIASFLLKNGSDVENIDLLGHTPLVLAQLMKSKDVLKIFDNFYSNSKIFENIIT
ncbi:L-asparaginase 1-like [Chelonus insularis]|uniref:L-asparaginase 1-like n=1 Tax=Chelonus insularis TaxID=460826 RepID=UPI00158F2717|nr:L-asparaginase 1-like [Chelonus insularis]XP_034938413.1 L-asparaginase 1-like [Chelonus insularis]XP_034938415.1 L-asparaginase 1-like [Chelonus insularis]XP_034938416.1 L-asparaginase 1-like [Chelonus insularis]